MIRVSCYSKQGSALPLMREAGRSCTNSLRKGNGEAAPSWQGQLSKADRRSCGLRLCQTEAIGTTDAHPPWGQLGVCLLS